MEGVDVAGTTELDGGAIGGASMARVCIMVGQGMRQGMIAREVVGMGMDQVGVDTARDTARVTIRDMGQVTEGENMEAMEQTAGTRVMQAGDMVVGHVDGVEDGEI